MQNECIFEGKLSRYRVPEGKNCIFITLDVATEGRDKKTRRTFVDVSLFDEQSKSVVSAADVGKTVRVRCTYDAYRSGNDWKNGFSAVLGGVKLLAEEPAPF